MMLRHFFSCLTVWLVLAILSGCGYSFVQKDRRMPGGYKLVAIPVFVNRTQETGIESIFTNALKREVHRSDLVNVSEEISAPASIVGTITSIQFVGGAKVTGTGDDTAGQIAPLPVNALINTDYRINIIVDISVRRNSDRNEIWSGRFRGERSYLAPQIGTESINSSNALYNHSARLQNLEIMAKDLMSEAYARMTENF